jgi:hypothetical protein
MPEKHKYIIFSDLWLTLEEFINDRLLLIFNF